MTTKFIGVLRRELLFSIAVEVSAISNIEGLNNIGRYQRYED
jgi:hypothetical protein